MSFFKKAMANVLGVGGAKIDTIITSKYIYPGEMIEGICKIQGGTVEQSISDITLNVNTSYKREKDDKTYDVCEAIQRHRINVDKTINPNEVLEIPFEFVLNTQTPVSIHKSKVWISTSLGIEYAIDSSDRDYIKVLPSKQITNILDAIENIGFKIREVENEYSSRNVSPFRFIQEFEFVPQSGDFKGRLDELEVFFVDNGLDVNVHMEIDRKVRGLGSFFMEELGLDESNVKVSFNYDEIDDLNYLTNQIYKIIASKA